MIISDINCMMGPWAARQHLFQTPAELLKELDSYRLTDCIAFHSEALWSPKRGNAQMKECAMGSSGRIKSCYVLSPNLGSSEMPEMDQLKKQLRDEKPSAVKLYPNLQFFRLDGFYSGDLLDLLNELEMPVLFDADQAPSYEDLPILAKAYPGIKFIILRHGFKESRYIIPIIKKLDNVFFDTSIMIDTGLIEEIVQKYGSDKLLFGSGMPFYVPAGGLGLILYSRIKDSDKEKILSENWKGIERRIQWK